MGAAGAPGSPRPSPALLAALACLSAAALAYEILLTRLFSIIQWHHFAYMAISVALLGYGTAGAAVALQRERVEGRLHQLFAVSGSLFGLAALGCFLLAQALPFNALELLWDGRQTAWLALLYLLLFVPFFFAGLCVCACFACHAAAARRLYSADILGAAAGSLGVVLALFAWSPMTVLGVVSLLGFGAAALAWRARAPRSPMPVLLLAAGALCVAASQMPFAQLRASPYKALSQALETMGARVVAERSSALARVTVVDSPQVPLRHAPGLSLAAAQGPPPQLGLYSDGEGPGAINRVEGDPEALAYLRDLSSAAGYSIRPQARVLVLGAGAGADIWQALLHGAQRVEAVELDPQVIELVEHRFADFSGRPYSRPGVAMHVGEARGFVAGSRARYDLIQIGLLDSFAAASAGLYSLAEGYLYTVEALRLYLDRLDEQGVLSITRWVQLPPRDTLKLFATTVLALEQSGAVDPARHVVLIRSWRTATLLVKRSPFTAEEIGALQAFCRQRSFDFGWYPGMVRADAARYNQLEEPYFYDGAAALLGPARDDFIARYKFDLVPATDDRPYFHRFFRWSSAPELLSLRARGGLPLLEWGYPLLVLTLAQAVLFAVVLVLLPLRRLKVASSRAVSTPRIAGYFTALGLAFMFVEIAFIQKFILFLSHPLYAIAVVLAGFLLSAGLGSAWAQRIDWGAGGTPVRRPIAGIVAICLVYLALLPLLAGVLAPLPDGARIAAALLLILPLGVCMGMPFPLGLEALARDAPAAVPWAWGINASVSVVSAVLATLLSVHLGFSMVILLALLAYAAAAALFPAAGAARPSPA